MPIVYVHGVATREEKFAKSWGDLEKYLRRYAAPAISERPEDVLISAAFWGDLAANFRFGGISRPRTPLLGMGPDEDSVVARSITAAEFADLIAVPDQPTGGGLLAAGPSETGADLSIRDLSADQLSDLVVTCASDETPAAWLIAADEAAYSPAFARVRSAVDDESALEIYFDEVGQALSDGSGLTGMGSSSWPEWAQRVKEVASRAAGGPGFVASRLVGEARKPVHEAAIRFLGDVFVYLRSRRDQDGTMGPIPAVVVKTLREAAAARLTEDEPLVVVTHSMGGQIVYDLLTFFLPALSPPRPRVDFWCATASQVGLFLDLNLFAAMDSGVAPLPRPPADVLGAWWNVWDYNDFLSFSAAGIVQGVDDEGYSSGLSLVSAHSGYLSRPSFHRRLAEKLTQAKSRGWDRR